MTAAGIGVQDLGPLVSPQAAPSALDVHETYASATLLGQFRTTMSSWLWLRTDLYLHNGVEMRQMTDAEKKGGASSESPSDDGNKNITNEETVLTIIPSKDRDFRGILGDIERATSAYKDMHHHTHNDPRVALPLFRLMTWLDPNFVPGWVTGASVIERDHSPAASQVALHYLDQGLDENPNSIAVLEAMSELYITRLHNLRKAVVYLERARDRGHHRDFIMDPAERDALQQSYRWLALCYRNLKWPEKEQSTAREGLLMFKDDEVLKRMAR